MTLDSSFAKIVTTFAIALCCARGTDRMAGLAEAANSAATAITGPPGCGDGKCTMSKENSNNRGTDCVL